MLLTQLGLSCGSLTHPAVKLVSTASRFIRKVNVKKGKNNGTSHTINRQSSAIRRQEDRSKGILEYKGAERETQRNLRNGENSSQHKIISDDLKRSSKAVLCRQMRSLYKFARYAASTASIIRNQQMALWREKFKPIDSSERVKLSGADL